MPGKEISKKNLAIIDFLVNDKVLTKVVINNGFDFDNLDSLLKKKKGTSLLADMLRYVENHKNSEDQEAKDRVNKIVLYLRAITQKQLPNPSSDKDRESMTGKEIKEEKAKIILYKKLHEKLRKQVEVVTEDTKLIANAEAWKNEHLVDGNNSNQSYSARSEDGVLNQADTTDTMGMTGSVMPLNKNASMKSKQLSDAQDELLSTERNFNRDINASRIVLEAMLKDLGNPRGGNQYIHKIYDNACKKAGRELKPNEVRELDELHEIIHSELRATEILVEISNRIITALTEVPSDEMLTAEFQGELSLEELKMAREPNVTAKNREAKQKVSDLQERYQYAKLREAMVAQHSIRIPRTGETVKITLTEAFSQQINQGNSDKIYALTLRSKNVSKYIKDIEGKGVGKNGFGLLGDKNFLIKPMQRFTKYPLLIEAIYKQESRGAIEGLFGTLKWVSEFNASVVNEAKREAENRLVKESHWTAMSRLEDNLSNKKINAIREGLEKARDKMTDITIRYGDKTFMVKHASLLQEIMESPDSSKVIEGIDKVTNEYDKAELQRFQWEAYRIHAIRKLYPIADKPGSVMRSKMPKIYQWLLDPNITSMDEFKKKFREEPKYLDEYLDEYLLSEIKAGNVEKDGVVVDYAQLSKSEKNKLKEDSIPKAIDSMELKHVTELLDSYYNTNVPKGRARLVDGYRPELAVQQDLVNLNENIKPINARTYQAECEMFNKKWSMLKQSDDPVILASLLEEREKLLDRFQDFFSGTTFNLENFLPMKSDDVIHNHMFEELSTFRASAVGPVGVAERELLKHKVAIGKLIEAIPELLTMEIAGPATFGNPLGSVQAFLENIEKNRAEHNQALKEALDELDAAINSSDVGQGKEKRKSLEVERNLLRTEVARAKARLDSAEKIVNERKNYIEDIISKKNDLERRIAESPTGEEVDALKKDIEEFLKVNGSNVEDAGKRCNSIYLHKLQTWRPGINLSPTADSIMSSQEERNLKLNAKLTAVWHQKIGEIKDGKAPLVALGDIIVEIKAALAENENAWVEAQKKMQSAPTDTTLRIQERYQRQKASLERMHVRAKKRLDEVSTGMEVLRVLEDRVDNAANLNTDDLEQLDSDVVDFLNKLIFNKIYDEDKLEKLEKFKHDQEYQVNSVLTTTHARASDATHNPNDQAGQMMSQASSIPDAASGTGSRVTNSANYPAPNYRAPSPPTTHQMGRPGGGATSAANSNGARSNAPPLPPPQDGKGVLSTSSVNAKGPGVKTPPLPPPRRKLPQPPTSDGRGIGGKMQVQMKGGGLVNSSGGTTKPPKPLPTTPKMNPAQELAEKLRRSRENSEEREKQSGPGRRGPGQGNNTE